MQLSIYISSYSGSCYMIIQQKKYKRSTCWYKVANQWEICSTKYLRQMAARQGLSLSPGGSVTDSAKNGGIYANGLHKIYFVYENTVSGCRRWSYHAVDSWTNLIPCLRTQTHRVCIENVGIREGCDLAVSQYARKLELLVGRHRIFKQS